MSVFLSGWLLPLLVGALTGILSGFGVGGGTILLLYLSVFTDLDQHTAQGINLLYFLPAAALALPAHFKNNFIDRRALLWCAASGLVSAGIAAWLAVSTNAAFLRRCFGAFLVVIGLWQLVSRPRK